MYKSELIDYLSQFDDSDDISLIDIQFLFEDETDILADQINEYMRRD